MSRRLIKNSRFVQAYSLGTTKFVICLLAMIPSLVQAESNEVFLTGILEFGKKRCAFFCEMPGNRLFYLEPGQEINGLSLIDLDAKAGWAVLRRGTNQFNLSLDRPVAGSDMTLAKLFSNGELPTSYDRPWPPGYLPRLIRLHQTGALPDSSNAEAPAGGTASAQYIKAIRDYRRQLAPEERQPFDAELQRFSAGPVAPTDSIIHAVNSAFIPDPIGSSIDQPIASASLPPGETDVPGSAIGANSPSLAQLQGSASEIRSLREQLRGESDPVIRDRIRQQLQAYTATPAH